MTTQFVSSGVVSSGVVVTSGNILEVLSGGTADVTSVTSGGVQQVDAGGFASGTVISAGGSDTVLGSETGAIIDSGGVLTLSGGSVNSITINSGGSLVLSGGFFSHIIDNGTLDFAGGGQGHMAVASGTGVVEVTNGGTLALSLVSSSSNFTGSFIIGDSSELLLTSAGAALGRPIDFAGANTELRIDDTVMPMC
jgi:autotransporter passenger strand-loop-strand repeat protein